MISDWMIALRLSMVWSVLSIWPENCLWLDSAMIVRKTEYTVTSVKEHWKTWEALPIQLRNTSETSQSADLYKSWAKTICQFSLLAVSTPFCCFSYDVLDSFLAHRDKCCWRAIVMPPVSVAASVFVNSRLKFLLGCSWCFWDVVLIS